MFVFFASFLQNIKFLPEPTLGPETLRSNLPPCEYSVADRVPTDMHPKASTIITLGEEALEWQQMTSDESDSEYDYEDDYLSDGEIMEGESGTGDGAVVEMKDKEEEEEEEVTLESYFSKSSSSSDSDEDYTVPYQRKRGGGSGRGRGRRGRGSGGLESRMSAPLTRPCVGRPKLMQGSATSKGPATSTMVAPPPLVSPHAGGPPSLIKTEGSRAIYSNKHLTPRAGTLNSHVQPPPALIVPKVGVVQMGGTGLKREPPPLVKKSEEPKVMKLAKVGDRHPQIVLPSPTSVGVGGESLMPGGILSAPHYSDPPTSTLPPAPVKRRPGRPRKDQSVALSSGHTQKTTRVHHLGQGRGRGRGGRGGGMVGLVQKSSTSARSIRMTQYEFQQHQQQSVAASRGVCLTQANHTPSSSVTTATPTQFQPLLFQPAANASLHSNIVTPLQIVSAGQATPTPMQMQTIPTIPHGSVIYLQGSSSPQQEQSPQYVTKDGRVYQILTPSSSANLGDRTKKLSVIMQPSAGAQPTYVQASDVGNFQYVTQLDGPPPPAPSSNTSNFNSSQAREGLKRKFELVRQRMAIMQLDGPQPPTRKKSSGRSSNKSPGESSGTSDKCIASDLLRAYFDRVQQCTSTETRQDSSSTGASSSTSGSAGDRAQRLAATKAPAVWRQDVVASRSSESRGKQSSSRSSKASPKGGREKKKQKQSSPSQEEVPMAGIPVCEKIHRGVSPTSPLRRGAESLGLPANRTYSSGADEVSEDEIAVSEPACAKEKRADILPRSPRLLDSNDGDTLAKVNSKKILVCPECGHKYTTGSGLKYHMTTQHSAQLKVSS